MGKWGWEGREDSSQYHRKYQCKNNHPKKGGGRHKINNQRKRMKRKREKKHEIRISQSKSKATQAGSQSNRNTRTSRLNPIHYSSGPAKVYILTPLVPTYAAPGQLVLTYLLGRV